MADSLVHLEHSFVPDTICFFFLLPIIEECTFFRDDCQVTLHELALEVDGGSEWTVRCVRDLQCRNCQADARYLIPGMP